MIKNIFLIFSLLFTTSAFSQEKKLKLSTDLSKVLVSVNSPFVSFKAQGALTSGELTISADSSLKKVILKGSSKNLSVLSASDNDVQTQVLLNQVLTSLPEGIIEAQSSSISKTNEKDIFYLKGNVIASKTTSPLSLKMRILNFPKSIELHGKTMKENIEFPANSPLKIFQNSLMGEAEVSLVFLR